MANPGKGQNKTPTQAATQSDAYSTWFINNIVLNHTPDERNKGYSVHTQRTWALMKEKNLDPKDTIEQYLKEYKQKFIDKSVKEQQDTFAKNHAGRPLADYRVKDLQADYGKKVDQEIPSIRAQLVEQIGGLRDIEHSIQGVRPTPERIADVFIENRVLPGMNQGTADLWKCIQNNGTDSDQKAIIDQFLPEHRKQISQEIEALKQIRSGVIQYEALELTPKDTVAVMRKGWEERNMPAADEDRYTQMLEAKIAGYSAHFDPQTACARAAVDIRAQIDRDRGAPPQSIVDENHTSYQGDIQTMGEWLRDRVNLEKNGSMPPAKAAPYGLENDTGLSKMTPLAFYSWKHSDGGYRLHRKEVLEKAMSQTYSESLPKPAPDPKLTTSAAQPTQQSAANTQAAAALEGKQLALANDVFQKYGVMLPAKAEIHSGADLVKNLRNPEFQKDLSSFGGMLPQEVKTALNVFNTLEAQRLAALSPAQAPTALALNANNPFRLKGADGPDDQVAKQSVTVGNMLATTARADGMITVRQALAALNRIPGVTTEGGPERVAAIEKEMGLQPGQTFKSNDPRLLEAAAAYANDTTIAALPDEWKAAFSSVSASLTTPQPDAKQSDKTLATQFTKAHDPDTSGVSSPKPGDTVIAGTPKVSMNLVG